MTKTSQPRAILRCLLALAMVATTTLPAAAEMTVTMGKSKDIAIKVYGYLENDLIIDSTQGYAEQMGSGQVAPRRTTAGAYNFAGQRYKTQMSARSSRLGMELTIPEMEGIKSQGQFEIDFRGSSVANANPGSTPAANTEATFFASAAPRIRQAFMSFTKGNWNLKAGQTWSLFGWQPYYAQSELVATPAPGGLSSRMPQFKLTHTMPLPNMQLESAVNVAKPAQMNSATPLFQGGLRLSSTKIKGGTTAGASSGMQSLSAGISGDVIQIKTNGAGNPTGVAMAYNVFVPILASSDGKNRSNTLSVSGELTHGNGYGFEYSSLTFGLPGVTATTKAGTAIDAGIASSNLDGNTELIRFRTYNVNLHYVFPNPKFGTGAGYQQADARNLQSYSMTGISGTSTLTNTMRYGYLSFFYDPLAWVRLGAEYSHVVNNNSDPQNRKAINNRFQFSTYLVF